MKTITLEEPGRLVLSDVPSPDDTPAPGQALVRVRKVGVCGTDFHAFRGKQPYFTYPRILGHELAVEVIAAGDGAGLKPGDRCAVNPYIHCGKCGACRRGRTNCCEQIRVLGVHMDGGMREQMMLPAAHLYPSDKLAPAQLALVETLGIGAHAVLRSAANASDRALVIGAGPIGLAVIEFLRVEGAEIALLEIDQNRREFCQSTYGIRECYRSAEGVLENDPSTVVFDCTGNKDSMQGALHFMAHGGRLVFVGLFVGDFTFHDPEFHRRETTLISSRNCTAPEHRRIIQLIEQGRIDTTPWVSEEVAASDMIARFPRWLERDSGVVKALIDWS